MAENWNEGPDFLDWQERIGIKGSHGNEAASPKTRGRKGQSTPDPRKARAFDSSDRITRELDRIGSAMLRGTLPAWMVEALGADDYKATGRTDEDHALATAHISRYRSIPQIVETDPSISDAWIDTEEGLGEGEHAAPEPSFEYVSENYRPRTLNLDTTAQTVHATETYKEGGKVKRRTLRTVRTLDEEGNVVTRGGDPIPLVDENGKLSTRVYRAQSLVKGPKERTTFVGHGPAKIDKAIKPAALKMREARGSDRRDAAVALLATLESIGSVVRFDDWSVTLMVPATKANAARLKAQRGADGPPVIGPPRKVATLLSR